MHRAKAAEFLLSRFTTREHAAAIVGDLMEIAPGPIAFSFAVLHTAAKFAVGPTIGVLSAATTGWLLRQLYAFAVRRSMPAPDSVAVFALASYLLGMIATYSVVRRGLSDLVTGIAAALCAIASAGMLLRPAPPVLIIGGVILELLLIASLVDSRSRSAVLRIIGAAVCALVASYLSWQLLIPTTVEPPQYPYRLLTILFVVPAAAVGLSLSWSRPAPPALVTE